MGIRFSSNNYLISTSPHNRGLSVNVVTRNILFVHFIPCSTLVVDKQYIYTHHWSRVLVFNNIKKWQKRQNLSKKEMSRHYCHGAS